MQKLSLQIFIFKEWAAEVFIASLLTRKIRLAVALAQMGMQYHANPKFNLTKIFLMQQEILLCARKYFVILKKIFHIHSVRIFYHKFMWSWIQSAHKFSHAVKKKRIIALIFRGNIIFLTIHTRDIYGKCLI